mmetsp:Transcript_24976/g.57717  ORF Transcript_24976/g.57717 Transcript_24976/m.57717 type:complete len:148 (+) Transcript_24976:1013-1456(+)
MIYAANVADGDLAEGNEMVERLKETADKEGAAVVLVSAQVEAELVELEADDRNDFLGESNITISSRFHVNYLPNDDCRLYRIFGRHPRGVWPAQACERGIRHPQLANVFYVRTHGDAGMDHRVSPRYDSFWLDPNGHLTPFSLLNAL